MNICKIPLTFPITLDFGCTADRVFHLAVPKDFEIVKTHMVIKGDHFTGDVFSKTVGTTASAKTTGSDGYTEIDPDGDIPANITAIIIDFHTPRTITGLKLQEIEFAPGIEDLFCIIRVNSGGSWFFPTPKNLFWPGAITTKTQRKEEIFRFSHEENEGTRSRGLIYQPQQVNRLRKGYHFLLSSVSAGAFHVTSGAFYVSAGAFHVTSGAFYVSAGAF